MVRPRCQGEESFFGRVKLEYPRLKKKHGIRWMDIQRPLLLESCLDYKLTKPSVRLSKPTSLPYASLTIILKKILGPQVSITSVAENI